MLMGIALLSVPLFIHYSPLLEGMYDRVTELRGAYCNPIELKQFMNDADEIVSVVIEAEKTFDDTGGLPIYMNARLDQAIYQEGEMFVPPCAYQAAQKLSCSIHNGQKYLQRKQQTDGDNPYISEYRACLREFYIEMEMLDQCFPLCKNN